MQSPYLRALAYACIVTLGGLVFGVDLGVIAGTFGYIKQQFGLTDLQVGTVGAAPGFGAIFALVFAGVLSDKVGRKKTLQVIAFLYLLSAIGSAFAPSFIFLVGARFLGGLAFCSLALASMYIGEISPSHLRGRLVAVNQFNIVIGLTAAYLINYVIQHAADAGYEWTVAMDLQSTAWRWMLGSEIPLALIWLALVCIIPESPRWLVMVGREDEARESLRKIMPETEIDAEVESVKRSMAKCHGAKRLSEQLPELFSPHARKAVIIAVIIATVQPITGINAINTYAPIIFAQAGAADPMWQTVWLGIVSLVANVFAFLLIDRLGRRPVVIWGLIWCAASLGLCAWGFAQATYSLDDEAMQAIAAEVEEEDAPKASQLTALSGLTFDSDIAFVREVRSVTDDDFTEANKDLLIGKAARINSSLILGAIVSFMAAFQFSIGPVMWVVLSEIFPTQLRGIAIPGAQLVTALVNYFVQQFFPWQLSNMGARDIFLFYFACVVVGVIALAMVLPETKNKSIEQIEAELSSASEGAPC